MMWQRKNTPPLPQMFTLIKTAVSAEDLKVSEASRRLRCSTVSESWDLSHPHVKNWSTRTSAIKTPLVNSWVTRIEVWLFNNLCWSFYSVLYTVFSCKTNTSLVLVVRDFDAAGIESWRGRRRDAGDRVRHSVDPLSAVRERHAPQG